MLYFVILEIIPMYTLESEVHVCIKVILKESFHQTRLAYLIEPLATNLKVVGSSSTVDKNFLFFIFRFYALFAGRLIPYKWN